MPLVETVQGKFPGVPQKFMRAALREKLNDEHKLKCRMIKQRKIGKEDYKHLHTNIRMIFNKYIILPW